MGGATFKPAYSHAASYITVRIIAPKNNKFVKIRDKKSTAAAGIGK